MQIRSRKGQPQSGVSARPMPIFWFISVWALGAFTLMQQAPENQQATSRGEEVFNTICSACHSLQPPAKLAPPMIMVVEHYFEKLETADAVKSAMSVWITTPKAENSALPEHAIERFGLMPPLQLPASDIDAVVTYLMEEHAKADMDNMHPSEMDTTDMGQGMMMGRGVQDGQGMMMGRGMQDGQSMMMGRGMHNGQGMMMGRGMHNGQRMMMQPDSIQHDAFMGRGMQNGQGMMMGRDMQDQEMMHQGMMMMMRGMTMMQQGMMRGRMSEGSTMDMQMNCPMHQQETEGNSEN